MPLVEVTGGVLTVAGDAKPWVEGEVLAFDDSFEHTARNDGEETHVALLVDICARQPRQDFSRAFPSCQRIPHAPCAMLWLAHMLIGGRLALVIRCSDSPVFVSGNPRMLHEDRVKYS